MPSARANVARSASGSMTGVIASLDVFGPVASGRAYAISSPRPSANTRSLRRPTAQVKKVSSCAIVSGGPSARSSASGNSASMLSIQS